MAQKSAHAPTAIEKLAAFSLSDHPALRTPIVRRQTRLTLLDTIGCAYAALSDGAMDPVLAHCAEMGGTPQATIIGGGKTSVLNAVLANGALVRGLDLNDVMFVEKDGHLAVSGHRSDNIPVALAMGERLSSSVRDVLDAIALNYELYGRLRAVMPAKAPWDGASVSAIVAAAMAGRMIGLDAVRQAHALALAATRTATPAIVRKGEISAAKNLANAFVAEAGVQAALLAEKGVTGPLQVLDHEDGLRQAFDPALGLDQLWATITAPAEIMSAHMKSYPSIGTSQTALTAALAAYPKLKGRIDAIEQIDVVMADLPAVRRQQGDKARSQPRSREAADHSFAFLVVVTLLDGRLTTKQFANERWLQPSIVALMQRVNLVVAADIRDHAPGSMPCRLRIKLKDGSEILEECLYPPGHSFADKGLDANAVIAKFKDVTSDAISPAQQTAIVAAALDTAEADKITGLMQHVRKA